MRSCKESSHLRLGMPPTRTLPLAVLCASKGCQSPFFLEQHGGWTWPICHDRQRSYDTGHKYQKPGDYDRLCLINLPLAKPPVTARFTDCLWKPHVFFLGVSSHCAKYSSVTYDYSPVTRMIDNNEQHLC